MCICCFFRCHNIEEANPGAGEAALEYFSTLSGDLRITEDDNHRSNFYALGRKPNWWSVTLIQPFCKLYEVLLIPQHFYFIPFFKRYPSSYTTGQDRKSQREPVVFQEHQVLIVLAWSIQIHKMPKLSKAGG